MAQWPEREGKALRDGEYDGDLHGEERSGSAKSRGFSPCHTPSAAIFTFTVDDEELDTSILSV